MGPKQVTVKLASTEQSSIAFISSELAEAGTPKISTMTPTATSGAVKGREFAWILPGRDSTELLPLAMFGVTYDDRWLFNRLMSPLFDRGV